MRKKDAGHAGFEPAASRMMPGVATRREILGHALGLLACLIHLEVPRGTLAFPSFRMNDRRVEVSTDMHKCIMQMCIRKCTGPSEQPDDPARPRGFDTRVDFLVKQTHPLDVSMGEMVAGEGFEPTVSRLWASRGRPDSSTLR